jgi:hypothetical protein
MSYTYIFKGYILKQDEIQIYLASQTWIQCELQIYLRVKLWYKMSYTYIWRVKHGCKVSYKICDESSVDTRSVTSIYKGYTLIQDELQIYLASQAWMRGELHIYLRVKLWYKMSYAYIWPVKHGCNVSYKICDE